MANLVSSVDCPPRVCIVILNWNGLEDTVECLESLQNVVYPNYDIVLVDNGSEGNDVEVLRNVFGDHMHIIENDINYGFAEGCNIGMRYALSGTNPDYILLLNNDVVVDPSFLTEMVKVADSDVQVGIVGPKTYFYSEPSRIQSAGGRINWWTGQTSLVGCTQIDNGGFDEVKEVDWMVGCALLVRRMVIEKVGWLYSGYFAYFEETELCARARKAGYRVLYAPRARIWHKRRLPPGRIDGFRLHQMTRNRFLFMKRNSTRPQLLSFFVCFFLKDVPLTLWSLLARQRDFKFVPRYFRSIWDGVVLAVKG